MMRIVTVTAAPFLAVFAAGVLLTRAVTVASAQAATCSQATYPVDCQEAYEQGCRQNGVYTIDPGCSKPFQVFCNMKNGGGWTVFQRRRDGSEDFYRTWEEYVNGFGNLRREFWLGLEHIHCLSTYCPRAALRVDLADFTGVSKYAHYKFFSVANADTNYKLNVNGYSGTAGNSLANHNNLQFSTKDRDNDPSSNGNCATSYQGAWWYNDCHHSNLNGLYRAGGIGDSVVVWGHFGNINFSLKFAEMGMRCS